MAPPPQYPDDAFLEYAAHSAATVSAYAAAHGYSFLMDKPAPRTAKVGTATQSFLSLLGSDPYRPLTPSPPFPPQSRSVHWNRVELLMKHVESGKWDWVLFVDSNVLIADTARSLPTPSFPLPPHPTSLRPTPLIAPKTPLHPQPHPHPHAR